MDGQVVASTPRSHRAAGLDKLGSVLAAVTAVTGAGALVGVSALLWRDNAILFMVAIAAFTGGVGCLVAFRDDGTTAPRVRRLSFVVTMVLLTIALVGFLGLIARTELTDSRPVITAMATGDAPLTISGNVTADGLGATERVSVKVVDQAATRFQAVVGAASEAGRATIPFEIRLNGRPDREITIVAWLTDRVATEPTCTDSTIDLPEVTCLKLALHGPNPGGPLLTISPNLSPGARSVTVSVAAIVGPRNGVLVNLWDRGALVYSFIARPGPDGSVNSSTVVPIHDNRAVLCAVAEIAAEASATTVPSPCVGTTFAQLVIPAVPGPTATATPAQ